VLVDGRVIYASTEEKKWETISKKEETQNKNENVWWL
jgi:hypothetical protein